VRISILNTKIFGSVESETEVPLDLPALDFDLFLLFGFFVRIGEGRRFGFAGVVEE
jgi:hypothetical protein